MITAQDIDNAVELTRQEKQTARRFENLVLEIDEDIQKGKEWFLAPDHVKDFKSSVGDYSDLVVAGGIMRYLDEHRDSDPRALAYLLTFLIKKAY